MRQRPLALLCHGDGACSSGDLADALRRGSRGLLSGSDRAIPDSYPSLASPRQSCNHDVTSDGWLIMPKSAKNEGSKKVNTSLRLEQKTLKALKAHAVENDTSVQKIVEKLVDGYLKKAQKNS